MNRRRLLRLVGGCAAFGAVALTTAGCSTDLPPEAIAAWAGPTADTDVRNWILGYAILAPNSHNRQAWLVDLEEPDVITLWIDPARLLPETDPAHRQSMMSQGTFLELIDQAARSRGLRADIALFPDGFFDPAGSDQRPIARIGLTPDPAVAREPLFDQVLRRRTNREPYASRIPPRSALDAIAASVTAPGFRIGFTTLDDPVALARQRRIASDAWRIELTTPRTLLESMAVLRIGPEEIAHYRDGLSNNEPFLRLINGLGLFDRSAAPAPDHPSIRSQITDFDDRLAHTPAFFWLTSADNDRVTQIDAGRAWMRAQLAATAQGLAMQPISQALQEFPEMTPLYRALHAELTGESSRETVQLWARLGYGPDISPAPRRGVAAHLVTV